MRNKTTLAVYATLLMGCLCHTAIADPVPAAIQDRYKTQATATEKLDLKAWDAYYAPEYVYVDTAGKSSNRTEYLADVHAKMKSAKSAKLRYHLASAKTHDGIADVAFDLTGKFTMPTGTATLHEVGTDSWKKIGTVWMLVKTVDTVMDIKLPKAKGK